MDGGGVIERCRKAAGGVKCGVLSQPMAPGRPRMPRYIQYIEIMDI